MNGHNFIKELTNQIQAIKYMGETCCNFGVSFGDYSHCEDKLCEFLHKNFLSIRECFDIYHYNNPNWTNVSILVSDFIELVEVGDYDEALLILTKNNTVWKYRHQLEQIEIKLYY